MKDNKRFEFEDYYTRITREDLLVSYKGPFAPSILAEIAEYIEKSLPVEDMISRKLFKMFIEMAQNTSFYSAEINKVGLPKVNERVGVVVIGEESDHYFLTTGNMVQKDYVQSLEGRCSLLNSLNHEELRKYRRSKRGEPANERGGANIGLVTLALTSRNPLQIQISDINEKMSFFYLTVTLDK